MKMNQCIDAGRPGCCPCELAEHGACLVCGKLRGETCQECSWQGVCIASLYEQNGRKLVKGRSEKLLPVREIRNYSDDFKVFILEADKGFCQKAQTAGVEIMAYDCRVEPDLLELDEPVEVELG